MVNLNGKLWLSLYLGAYPATYIQSALTWYCEGSECGGSLLKGSLQRCLTNVNREQRILNRGSGKIR